LNLTTTLMGKRCISNMGRRKGISQGISTDKLKHQGIKAKRACLLGKKKTKTPDVYSCCRGVSPKGKIAGKEGEDCTRARSQPKRRPSSVPSARWRANLKVSSRNSQAMSGNFRNRSAVQKLGANPELHRDLGGPFGVDSAGEPICRANGGTGKSTRETTRAVPGMSSKSLRKSQGDTGKKGHAKLSSPNGSEREER